MAELVKVLAMCLAILGLMSLQAFGSPVESDGKMTGGTSWSSISKATKYCSTSLGVSSKTQKFTQPNLILGHVK